LDQVKSDVLVCCIEHFKIFLIVVYHPYWGNVKQHQEIVEHLQIIIDKHVPHDYFLFVCGDFNDLRHYFDTFVVGNDLTQVVDITTRGKNTLDLLFVPSKTHSNSYEVSGHNPLGRSDHKVILLQPAKPNVVKRKIRIRKYSPKQIAIFGEKLSKVDWNTCLSIFEDVDEITSNYNDCLYSLFDQCFPLKTVTLSSKDQPWVTPKLKMLMAEKDRAFHKKNKTAYISLREQLDREIKHCRNQFYQTEFKRHNPWRTINKIMRKSQKHQTLSEVQATRLNEKFSKVFIQDDRKATLNGTKAPIALTISQAEIVKAIQSIKSNASGPDLIPGFIYRKFAHILAYPLSAIYNASMTQCKFPSCWKLANIVPIPKGQSDFRPISLLSFPSKVFEKIVSKNLILPHVLLNIKSNQHGFIPTKSVSTTTAVTLVKGEILNKVTSNGGYVRCLAVDFQKAFDRVSHTCILKQASLDFNIPENTCYWLKSYLEDRRQRVIFDNGNVTQWKECTSGVPQGSVLGPMLFCIIMNSYTPISPRTKSILYADDLTLTHSVGPGQSDELQAEILNLISWCNENKMKINPTKCQLLNTTFTKQTFQPIYIEHNLIQPSTEIKLLGVLISENMSSKSHGLSILKKCALGMAIIRRLRRTGLHNNSLWMAYLAFVRSHIIYCWPAICDMPTSIMQKYHALERQAQLLCGNPKTKSLSHQLNDICSNLIKQITRCRQNPLRCLFLERLPSSQHLRTQCQLLPMNRSNKVMKSFAKYYKLSTS